MPEIDPALLQVGLVLKEDVPFPAPACVVTSGILLDGTNIRNRDALKCDVLWVDGERRWRCWAPVEANRSRLFSGHRAE